jgi:hypothetical protein
MILGTTAEYHQLTLSLLKDGDTCRIPSREINKGLVYHPLERASYLMAIV